MKKIIFTLILGSLFFASCKTSVQQPEYRDIRDLRVINIGMLESTAGVDMVYYNPNNFGVNLTEASGEFYIDNNYIGRFSLEREIRVDKNSEFVVPGLLKIDMVSAVKNGQNIINKKEALVKITGNARVKKAGVSANVPISYEGMQNIEKFRQMLYK